MIIPTSTILDKKSNWKIEITDKTHPGARFHRMFPWGIEIGKAAQRFMLR